MGISRALRPGRPAEEVRADEDLHLHQQDPRRKNRGVPRVDGGEDAEPGQRGPQPQDPAAHRGNEGRDRRGGVHAQLQQAR